MHLHRLVHNNISPSTTQEIGRLIISREFCALGGEAVPVSWGGVASELLPECVWDSGFRDRRRVGSLPQGHGFVRCGGGRGFDRYRWWNAARSLSRCPTCQLGNGSHGLGGRNDLWPFDIRLCAFRTIW